VLLHKMFLAVLLTGLASTAFAAPEIRLVRQITVGHSSLATGTVQAIHAMVAANHQQERSGDVYLVFRSKSFIGAIGEPLEEVVR